MTTAKKKKTWWRYSGFKPFAKQKLSSNESDSDTDSEPELAKLGFNSIIDSDSDDSLEIAASFKSVNSKEFRVQTSKVPTQAIKEENGIPVVKIKPKVDQRSGIISVPDSEASKVNYAIVDHLPSKDSKSQLLHDLKQLRDGLNSTQNNVIQSTHTSDSTMINRNDLDPDKSLNLNISIIESEKSSNPNSWIKPVDDNPKQVDDENLILKLQQKLKISQDRISELESENEKVYSTFQTLRQEQLQNEKKIEELELIYLEVYNRARDAEATAKMYIESFNRTSEIQTAIESITSERDELLHRCRNAENTTNDLYSERDELFILKETLIEDIKVMNDRLEYVKKQEKLQEKEFDLFSQKIQSQQTYIKQLEVDNNELKMKLRKLQYEPSGEQSSKLESALFDIEALQLLVKDLRAENDLLLNAKTGSAYDYNPNNERPKSVAQSQNPIAFENRSDINILNKSPGIGRNDPNRESQRSEQKQGKRLIDPKRESKQGYLPPSPLVQKTNNNEVNHYFEQKERLDFELNFLTQEKQKLTFELSRVPSSGGKALQRQDEIEDQLDVIDHRMATIRKQMREYNIL